MKKVLFGFQGEFPVINAVVLPPNAAVRCHNAKLRSGGLRPYKASVHYFTPTKPGVIKSIFRYAGDASDPSSGYLFHWDKVVDVVRGPVKEDTAMHMYFTGDGKPKYTWYDIAITDSFYPSNDFLLGVPVPLIGPLATANPDGGADETVDKVTRAWAITLVTPDGEEGPPALSNDITVWPDQTSTLSNLPGAPSGDYNLGPGAFKRIYRTATGDDGTGFYLEGDHIPMGQTTFVSSIADTELGVYLETTNWLEPPEGLHSLVSLTNGILAGAAGNTVYYSMQNLPHAWNPLNSDVVIHNVVGMGSYDTTLVVCTEKNPILISGSSPDTMGAYELRINQACVSKPSIASGSAGVLFASPDGLILIGPGGDYRNATDGFFSRDEWQALNPMSVMGVMHDDTYICFYENETEKNGFILDPSLPEAGIVKLGFHATAAFSDPMNDQLLLVVDGDVVAFDKGEAGNYVWRGKLNVEAVPVTFTVARIVAGSYKNLTFRLYVDGKHKCSLRVRSKKPFRLPDGYRAMSWQVELEGTDEVTSVELGECMGDLIGGL